LPQTNVIGKVAKFKIFSGKQGVIRQVLLDVNVLHAPYADAERDAPTPSTATTGC
jgi:hypothetical protein